MAERITIKDIARELNIHHSTVSRALRNDDRVKKETREMIISYAKKHGYQVNMNALQLRGNVRNIIAVIIPNIHHMFFSNLVSLIANRAKEDGYIVSIFQSNESVQEEREIIQTVIQNNVAGVMASVSLQTDTGKHFNELKSFGIPLVFFDRVCKKIQVSKVTVNSTKVVLDAVALMVEKGHKRIAHITGTNRLNVFHDRQVGYLEGIKKHDLAYEKMVSIDKEFTPEDGENAVNQLWQNSEIPDGLIIDSHNLTIGVIKALWDKNLRIPEDVGIIGFGDNPSVNVIRPAITTIVQPEQEIAEIAYRLLKKQIDSNDELKIEEIEVSSKLVIRESC